MENIVSINRRQAEFSQLEYFGLQLSQLCEKIDALEELVSRDTKLIIRTREGIQLLRHADIVRFEASGNYTIIFLESGKKILASVTLKSLEERVSSYDFIRVHASHLVCKNRIKTINSSELYVALENDTQVPVARSRRTLVIDTLAPEKEATLKKDNRTSMGIAFSAWERKQMKIQLSN